MIHQYSDMIMSHIKQSKSTDKYYPLSICDNMIKIALMVKEVQGKYLAKMYIMILSLRPEKVSTSSDIERRASHIHS